MDSPLVSIVIPTHNRLTFLKEAVDSVQNQTFQNWELMVVDDASTDTTWDWLQGIESPQIRVFRQEQNLERSAARNLGLNASKGQLIMFLDDDDYLRPDALKSLTLPFLNDPNIVATVGARWKFRIGEYALRIDHPHTIVKTVIWPEILFGGWCAVSGQNLYRKEIVLSVGGYSSDFVPSEDRQLWFKVAKEGTVCLIPNIVLNYRSHGRPRRPENIEEIREAVFQDCITKNLDEQEKHQGYRIRESARLLAEADKNSQDKLYFLAFRNHLRAALAAPRLLFSPLVGQQIRRGMMKSLFRLFVHK